MTAPTTRPARPTDADGLAALQNAIEFAPSSGRVAPDLRGVWAENGYYVCALCVGRITARGCGYVLGKCEQVWRSEATPFGVCATCGEGR